MRGTSGAVPDRSEVAPPSEDVLREAYGRTLKACCCAGLAVVDAEDLAQDIFLWLLRHRHEVPPLSGAWLGAVVRNFVMRYRRRTHRDQSREGAWVDGLTGRRVPSAASSPETTVSVLRLEELLPPPEAGVLHEMRLGATWAEATARLGVPPGSRDWLRKRMAEHVRDAFTPRRAGTQRHSVLRYPQPAV
jgi:DNA-directed RNA polymerase specialized sigma24 family protein